jgi:hypothetical protein
MIENIIQIPDNLGKNEMNSLFQAQFNVLLNDKALQKIMHWGLGEKNKVLRKISDQREEVGEKILTILDIDFENSDVDIRALLALQLAGIYYLSLHSKSYGTTFCGIDINAAEGKQRISKAIQNSIEMTYDRAKVNK